MRCNSNFKLISLACGLVLVTTPAWSQQAADAFLQEPVSLGEGWRGFTDVAFLLQTTLTLAIAAFLGAVVAYHPRHGQTADTLEDIEAPKIFIVYAVIGALIGIMVVKYGLVVGFVLFGIGGLIRFRTTLRSASLTGRVILVTLIGLSCGLDLPHVAVLATVFSFALIYIVDTRVTYRIDVKALPADRVAEAAGAYRTLLEQHNCRIMSEKKNPGKNRAMFIFQGSRNLTRVRLEELLETEIDGSLRGSVDWEID